MAEYSTVRSGHWNEVYNRKGEDQVSWFEPEPTCSLSMLDALGVAPSMSVLDVGGGAARLVDVLVHRGFSDLSVLDVSAEALGIARARLGDADASVKWIETDLLSWRPTRSYDVWHDRAVFHFLTSPADREVYRRLVRQAVPIGGRLVVGTFAANGPEQCSGLPTARYDSEQLLSALGEGLEIAAVAPEEHRTPSGATHAFTWIAATRRV